MMPILEILIAKTAVESAPVASKNTFMPQYSAQLAAHSKLMRKLEDEVEEGYYMFQMQMEVWADLKKDINSRQFKFDLNKQAATR